MITAPGTTRTRSRRRWIGTAAAVATLGSLVLAGCSTSADGGEGSEEPVTITMWTRAATQIQSQALVDAYNASHETQVELTVIPTDDYQTKIGAAAGAGSLPDLFASDVVYTPNYTSAGLFLDITDRIDALPFVDDLAPSHIDAGTWEGKKYTVPHTMDLSVMFYNKDLYEKAGLDPEAPPATLAEFGEHATAIAALGNGVSGTYFGGNCGGCLAFTWWPSIWASGAEVISADGNTALLDSPEAKEVFAFYRGLVENGVTAPGTKDENGATWVAPFPEGTVGLMPMPSTMLGEMPESTGVSAIPGIDGGESTFVGGDAIGIGATSSHADEAWDFLSWSLGDEAQVEVLAKNGDVLSRTDLADNKYSSADPRVVRINEIAGTGRSPYALNYGAAFNDPNGPWLMLLRDAIFGDASAISKDNAAITAVLGG